MKGARHSAQQIIAMLMQCEVRLTNAELQHEFKGGGRAST